MLTAFLAACLAQAWPSAKRFAQVLTLAGDLIGEAGRTRHLNGIDRLANLAGSELLRQRRKQIASERRTDKGGNDEEFLHLARVLLYDYEDKG